MLPRAYLVNPAREAYARGWREIASKGLGFFGGVFSRLARLMRLLLILVGSASGMLPILILFVDDFSIGYFLFLILSGYLSCIAAAHLWTSKYALWKKLLFTLLLQMPILGVCFYWSSHMPPNPLFRR